ncbi:MAG: AAA family ATPase, partial [bacterium]
LDFAVFQILDNIRRTFLAKCQQENPADSNFCVNCGRKLERECPFCATSPPPDTAFCKGCGRALADNASRPEIGTEKPPPGAPTGERRQATIVFSDLSGYTAMNEKLDPEEVEAIMSRVKDEAVRIVEDYGGIVNQFVGDEVLALFGIPAAHEDDPRRAVRAALELHEWVRGISPQVEARIGAPLTLHTGINTGLVVTHFRDEREGRHGITGDSVNTAARIVDQADADEILISLDTQRRIAHFFVTEAREPMAFKGKARPMSVFRIVGKTTVQTRFEAAKKSGLSAFTGREEELAALLARMDRASAGQGQLVAVSGEAGIGKTRLLHEFQLSLDSSRIETVPGRFLSHENAAPNLPFVEVLRHILKLRDQEAAAESLKKAIANIRAIDTGLEQNIPLYLHLLGIPAKDHQIPPTLSGEELRKALDQALVAIILGFSRRKPAVLILENWRWVDEASDAVLKKLLDHIASHPLMVVVVFRPDFEPAWELPPDHYEKVTLRPLGPEEDQTLMKSVVGSRHLPEGLAELVYGRTGGIPFFTEEVCRDLLAKEILLVMGGEAAITCLLSDISLPDSIQAVIRSRLDRLDGAARHVLRISSVIGQEFSLPVLERAFEDHDQLHQGLTVLQGQGLIRRVNGGPEQSFVFDQVTTQMVAYDTLLLQQRKALHELIGKAIEEVYANRPEDHFKALGHHFSKSANVDKALHYLNLAGDRFKKYFSLG